MTRRGVLEETALALAEATWRDPILAAVALLVSTLLVRDVWWDVGAMFLAGAALRGSSWKLRGPLLIGFAALFFQTYTPFQPEWYERDHVPLAIATAVAVVVLVLGARGRPRAGIVVGAAAVVASAVARAGTPGWSLPARGTGPYVVSLGRDIVLAGWPAVAGLAVRARADVGDRPESARLVVGAQLRPWTAASVVAAFVLFCCLSFPLTDAGVFRNWSLPSLMALSFGASLLANLTANSRTSLGVLAAPLWLTSAVFVTWAASDSRRNVLAENLVLGQTAAAVLWPAVIVRVMPRPSPALGTFGALVAFAVALVVPVVFASYWWSGQPHGGSTWLWTWLAIAPIAFQAATGVTASSRWIVFGATVLGAAVSATFGLRALVQGRFDWSSELSLDRHGVFAIVGVCFLGGVYVVLARRAQSLTAVTLDAPA